MFVNPLLNILAGDYFFVYLFSKANIMENKLRTFNQCNSLVMWLNMNSKYKASFAYDGQTDIYAVDVYDEKGEVFSYAIESVSLKGDKRLTFEFGTIAVVLIKLKETV